MNAPAKQLADVEPARSRFHCPLAFSSGSVGQKCPALHGFGHAQRAAALSGGPIYVDVGLLAATAALRHSGAPYAPTLKVGHAL